ncbi:hypothetical protein O7623_16570 [Solwaraspora sp. WMMD791]|uniref:hypothetical protein n=1 Tax=Solwaraspora sp. WMMD791 TaxID=3016086 RepID=UPI00249B9C4A|nr:hypothetical protein [Solwaraspora sp. WMMD791]WFE25036.1 hypothetical protein O7623_16570 [Solwaraspora sp. WMMD791]
MKRHRTDVVSLTFGLIFSLIAGWWLVSRMADVPLPQVGWVVAGGLILIGVLGLVGALRSGRGDRSDTQRTDTAPTGVPSTDAPPVDAPPVGMRTDPRTGDDSDAPTLTELSDLPGPPRG